MTDIGRIAAHVGVRGGKVGMVRQSVCQKHTSFQKIGEQDQVHEPEDELAWAGTRDLQILQGTYTDDCSDHIISEDRYRGKVMQ